MARLQSEGEVGITPTGSGIYPWELERAAQPCGEESAMEQAVHKIASKHHTTTEQVECVCRLLAHQIDGFLAEIDECPETVKLSQLAERLRRAGQGRSECRALRLVP